MRHINSIESPCNLGKIPTVYLSYDVAVIQWIKSCYENGMNTRVMILWRVDVTSLTTSVSAMRFLAEIMLFL